jgi:hypothetical protein
MVARFVLEIMDGWRKPGGGGCTCPKAGRSVVTDQVSNRKLDDRFISQVLEGRHVAIVNAGPSTREHE